MTTPNIDAIAFNGHQLHSCSEQLRNQVAGMQSREPDMPRITGMDVDLLRTQLNAIDFYSQQLRSLLGAAS